MSAFIRTNKGYITEFPKGKVLMRLQGGRAFLVSEIPEDIENELLPEEISKEIRNLAKEVSSRFVGMGEVAEAVSHAIAAGQHIFLLGPPGTAKSSILRAFAEGIGGKFFRIVLNPDTTREDLVGPIDPVSLAQGKWTRRWSGLAVADLALLDEIWKASPQVVNMILDALEERRLSVANEEKLIPLISALAASNEVPEERESLAAYDRFLIRIHLSYLRDPDHFRQLFSADAGRTPITSSLSPEKIRLLAAYIEYLALTIPRPSDYEDTLMELWKEVPHISNRRWVRTHLLAVTRMVLNGDKELKPNHLSVARWTLWAEPEETEDISNLVLGLTDPLGGKVLSLEALLEDLKKEAQDISQMALQERASLAGKARQVVKEADGLLQESGIEPYRNRVEAVKSQATKIQEAVFDSIAGGGTP